MKRTDRSKGRAKGVAVVRTVVSGASTRGCVPKGGVPDPGCVPRGGARQPVCFPRRSDRRR